MSTLNDFKKKFISKRGMSLAEVLVATIILVLATQVVVSCISLGSSLFDKEKKSTQAQMLIDAITVSVQDELRYATSISSEEGVFTYSSRNRAGKKNCSLMNDTVSGHIVVNAPGGNYELVPDDMYGDLAAQLVTAAWDGERKVFTISISVIEKGDTKKLAEKTFKVEPLNSDYNSAF